MKLLKRLGYYLIGVSLGSILVLFIWQGKDTTFDYGPNARTLKSIRKKNLEVSNSVQELLLSGKLSHRTITTALKKGNVIFSKSKARIKPCAQYFIETDSIDLYVERCDSTAIIKSVALKYNSKSLDNL